jgi:hypothetical protein
VEDGGLEGEAAEEAVVEHLLEGLEVAEGVLGGGGVVGIALGVGLDDGEAFGQRGVGGVAGGLVAGEDVEAHRGLQGFGSVGS